MIPHDFAEFCAGGVATAVATRDGRLVPECLYAIGVRVHEDDGEMTVLLPRATADVTVANLRDNGRIAVTIGRPHDHRTFQVKGRAVAIGDASESDREWLERHRAALAEEYALAGVPPSVTFRIAWWPCAAVRFHVEGLFHQTPGPGAGSPIGDGARSP